MKIEQEIMEMFDKEFFYLTNIKVTHYNGEDYEKAKLLQKMCNNTEDKLKSFISHIITLVQKREREEMVGQIKKVILENSYEEYSGSNGFLRTNTDSLIFKINNLIKTK